MDCDGAPQMNGVTDQIKLSSLKDAVIGLTESVTDNERAKRKADRRRAKKKRQRERRKLEKGKGNEENEQDDEESESEEEMELSSKPLDTTEDTNGQSDTVAQPFGSSANPHLGRSSSSDEEPEWDVTSAFVTNAASHIKAKVKLRPGRRSKENKENEGKSQEEGLDPSVLRSRELAEQGIDLAKQGYYSKAVELFTAAVQFDPNDHRYFGNRSYCYDRLGKYSLALEDAETSIRLDSKWPKGYFRKGRALLGIKRYLEAEMAFEVVLQLDKGCQDAINELFNVRILRLMNEGFTQQQSVTLLQEHKSVKAALESPLASTTLEMNPGTSSEIADGEDSLFLIDFPIIECQTELPCRSLWVGNITVHVKEKQLKDLFKKFGEVQSVQLKRERRCVNANCRCRLLDSVTVPANQGKEIENTKLLIRYPDRHLSKSIPQPPKPPAPLPITVQPKSLSPANGVKRRGPVHGGECYFWRTTGCHFGDKCRYKHIPRHKEVDKKPWQH
uniref:Uncharacterized LOC103191146 n=1 Tax=Callorhinchus milii TaxID=7868 RepID=A0A4W3IKG7_CALMI